MGPRGMWRNTSPFDAGEWSASGPGRFTLGECATGTHLIRRCMGPIASLGVLEIISCLCRDHVSVGCNKVYPNPKWPGSSGLVLVSKEHRIPA